MKTRVLSMRVGYDTIAYCYQLQEKAGRAVVGKPMSTIVSDTLEAIVLGTIRMQGLVEIQDESDALVALSKYADKIPAFNGVVPMWGDGKTQAPPLPEALRTALVKENPGQTERGETAEPVRVLGEVETFYPEFLRRCGNCGYGYEGFCSEHSSEINNESGPCGKWKPAESGSCYMVPDDAPGPAVSVEDRLEQLAQAEELLDEQALKKTVDLGVVDRVSPDIEPMVTPKCPWEGVDIVSEDLVNTNPIFNEAVKIDELYGIAVRVVLTRFPSELWGSDKAINMAKKVYKDYKNWEEKYGKANAGRKGS